MNWQISLISTVLGLQLWGTIGQPTLARSPIANFSQTVAEPTKQTVRFRPPEGIGRPPTFGGGTRSPACYEGEELPDPVLTPIIPVIESPQGDVGLTVSARPEFFVYVPPTLAEEVEFVLRDDEWNDVYRQQLLLSGDGRMVRVKFPETEKQLEVDRVYTWYFALICPPDERGLRQEVHVVGWIRRISPEASLEARLRGISEGDRPRIYAENGIWYDAVSSLAAQLRTNPSSAGVLQQWKDLLESAGLANIARLPAKVE